MNIEREDVASVVVVRVGDPVEIDVGNADEFKHDVLAEIGDAVRVVLDLSRVSFFDSAGMGALLSVQKRMAERGGAVVLAGLSRAVSDIFRMVGFDVVFVCVPDVERGIRRLTPKEIS